MEKLSLEKFKDSKLESKSMSFVSGGDTCTGGGFCNQWNADFTEVVGTVSWDSDSRSDSGRMSYGNIVSDGGLYFPC
jgi:natural product precursor